MASQTQIGFNWAKESFDLFKRAPKKWLLLGLVYIFFFVMLPAIPGLQLLALVAILAWPAFLAFALSLYRNEEQNKTVSLLEVIESVKPHVTKLISLGLVCFTYGILVGMLLNSDLQGLMKFANAKVITNEHLVQALAIVAKTMLLMLPLFMVTWFSPMLIKQNGYQLMHALKSSIAGCIQYFAALSVAWLVLTLAIIGLMLLLGAVSGLLGVLLPLLGQLLMPVALLFTIVFATALMLAFQYVSYRDAFRAAQSVE